MKLTAQMYLFTLLGLILASLIKFNGTKKNRCSSEISGETKSLQLVDQEAGF